MKGVSRVVLCLVLRWAFALAALGGVQGLAVASIVMPNGTVGINYVTGGAQLIDGSGGATFVGRTFADPSVSARTVGLTETYGVQLGGRALTVQAARVLTAAEVGGAVAGVYLAWEGGWAVGSGIARWMGLGNSSNGTRCVPGPGGWQCDAGQPPEVQHVSKWCFDPVAGPCGGSPEELAAAYVSQTAASDASYYHTYSPGAVTCTKPDPAHATCSYSLYRCQYASADSCETFTAYTPGYQYVTITLPASCPATIDPLDPRLSRPAGDAPGPDGKCAAARYSAATPQQVGERIGTYGDPSLLKSMAQDVLDKGQPITTASPRSVTGPASATGSPTTTTTTNPDGTTTTVTKTPTINYHYDGDTITYNTTYVTVTNDNGDVTTTTTTEGDTPEQKTDCDKYPDSAGCTKLGDPGTDKVTGTSRNVTFTPVEFAGGSCPDPVTFSVFGLDLSFAFTPICDTASTWIRLVLLVSAAAMGAYIFIGGLKA